MVSNCHRVNITINFINYIFRYILGTPLDFSQHRGGILLQTEKKRRSSSSKLTLSRLAVSDSGLYTCSPVGAHNSTVRIMVEGQKR